MKNQLKEKKMRNKKIILIICIILIILFSYLIINIIIYWGESLGSHDIGPHPIFKFTQKDVDVYLNETDLNQSIIIITSQSNELIVWDDINIQLSEDGINYHNITLSKNAINIIMRKVENKQGDPRCWEECESLIFLENGESNWNPDAIFYCKIFHLPTGATLHEENTMVI